MSKQSTKVWVNNQTKVWVNNQQSAEELIDGVDWLVDWIQSTGGICTCVASIWITAGTTANKYTLQPHRKMMNVYSTSCSACKRARESTVKRQHSIVLTTIASNTLTSTSLVDRRRKQLKGRHYGAEPTVSSGPQAVEEIAGR